MTRLVFRDDAYAKETEARIIDIDERGGIVLDQTVFYATAGGQPGDCGALVGETGTVIPIATAVYGPDKGTIVHVPAAEALSASPGEVVTARIDWDLRHRRMRVHTALHLLTAVLPYPVTGGAIGDGEGRLDFDIPDAGLDRDEIASRLNGFVARAAAVGERWITDAELDANPGLVKTMSVQPPRGSGRIRLVEIEGIDLQPCGGTHVRNTAEIGTVLVTGIEKKGRLNRRVRIALA